MLRGRQDFYVAAGVVCLTALVLCFAPTAHAQERPVLMPQQGHCEGVPCITFSPDGRILASASRDASIVLWDAVTGEVRHKLHVHTAPVNTIAFSPNGRTLASGSDDKTIVLWDVASGQIRRLPTPDIVKCIAFSPNGRMLASGHQDGSKVLWNTATGKVVNALKEGREVNSVTFSPDEQTVVAQVGNEVCFWDGTTHRKFEPAKDAAGCVAFSPNGRILAWGNQSGTVTLSDGQSVRPLKGHTGPIGSIAFSPDGRTLASGSGDWTVILWDVASGTPRSTLRHGSGVLSIAFSPNGQMLAYSGCYDEIILCEAATGVVRHSLRGRINPVEGVAFSPDGRTLAVGHRDEVRLWNTATGEAQVHIIGTGGGGRQAFSPDGRTLASCRYAVCFWDAVTGASRGDGWSIGPPGSRVSGIAFHPDGRTLASANSDNTVILWDLLTSLRRSTLVGHTGPVLSVAYSPDGRTLASGSADSTIILWDTATGKPIRTVRGHQKAVTSVAFSPDGQILASASADQTVILWTQATQRPLLGHRGEVTSIAFSPDGRLLASASLDKTVVLWDVASGKPLRVLGGGNIGGFTSVAFSPDGERLAAGCRDGSVRLWHVRSGVALATLIGIGGEKDWIAMTPEGYYNGSTDGVRLLRWLVRGQLFPVEAYETVFCRRDLVAKAMQGETLLVSAEHQRLMAGQSVPPYVAFLTPRDGQEVAGDQISVEITATDDRDVTGLFFLVNGRPMTVKPIPSEAKPIPAEAKPIPSEAKPIPTSHNIYRQFKAVVPLPAGESRVTLKAVAYDAEGLRGWTAINLTRPITGPVIGDLYMFTVGVSRYKTPQFNLKYAARDADAFADLWKRAEGTLYRRVVTARLTDTQATAANVRTTLSNLLATATDKDTVVLFLSGHGIQVKEGEFYFATFDVDLARPAETALPWMVFQDTLAQTKAKRVVLFLDACHSGHSLGGQQANTERLAELLVKRAGVMVFASSRGSEFSYELAEKQHGAFTAALMEGIGEGKADLEVGSGRDGVINVEELLTYLRARVPQLTGNQQTPTCPLMRDFGEPFPLAKVK